MLKRCGFVKEKLHCIINEDFPPGWFGRALEEDLSVRRRGWKLREERLALPHSLSMTASRQTSRSPYLCPLTNGLPHIHILSLREEDAGEYYCLLAGEEASVSTSCRWEQVFLQHLFICHVCQADGVQRTWPTWPTPGSRPASGAGGELEGRQREAGRRVAGCRHLGPCGHS